MNVFGFNRTGFVDRQERYFAGDLDKIERTRFLNEVERSRLRRRQFRAEYERRTKEQGLMAMWTIEPGLSDCFSPSTLEAYAEGRLPAELKTTVEGHLPCPLCQVQLSAIQEAKNVPVVSSPWEALWAGFIDLVARPSVVALSAALCFAAIMAVGVIQLHAPGTDSGSSDWVAKFRSIVGDVEVSPSEPIYRTVGDNLATVGLYAVTSEGRRMEVEPGERLPADARLQIRGVNDDLDHSRFFAVLSISETGEILWHLPAWDGPIPPSMIELPAGADPAVESEGSVFEERQPTLEQGSYRVVVLLSQQSANVKRVQDYVEQNKSLLLDTEEKKFPLLGRSATASFLDVIIP